MHEPGPEDSAAPKSKADSEAGCWGPPAIPSARQGASVTPAASRVLSGSTLHSTQAATQHNEQDRTFAQAQDPPVAHSSTSKLPQGHWRDSGQGE